MLRCILQAKRGRREDRQLPKSQSAETEAEAAAGG